MAFGEWCNTSIVLAVAYKIYGLIVEATNIGTTVRLCWFHLAKIEQSVKAPGPHVGDRCNWGPSTRNMWSFKTGSFRAVVCQGQVSR